MAPAELAPSSPPMSAPPSPPSTPPHSKLLDSYAAHMKSLSVALDSRAHALRTAEARLESRGSALRAHERALASLERRMRSEMTAFLRDVAARQRQLSRWEQRAEKGRKLAAAISKNKDELRNTKNVLEDKTSELHLLEKEYATLIESKHSISTELDAARSELSRMANEARRIAEEKSRLETLAERLESLEAAVRKRERDVDASEAAITVKSDRLSWLEQFERVVTPLQTFVDEFASFEHRDTVSIRDDVPKGVQMALNALREMRSRSKVLNDHRAELEAVQATISDREKALRDKELATRQREHDLDVLETRLSNEQDKISLQTTELRESIRSLDDTRTEHDRREEGMHKKERELLQRESKLSHRETVIAQSEKTLARRERSIRRAHAAVTEREKAIDAREREVENERANFDNMKRSIDLREAMLETRELELVAREASLVESSRVYISENSARRSRQDMSLDADVHAGSDKDSHGANAGGGASGVQVMGDAVDKNTRGDGSPPRKRHAPRSVRRQLEFETAHRRIPASNMKNEQDAAQKDGDDESEVAAEQLLPELVGARALWKERILRLEAVVRNMRENTWGLKPHVQPVLTAVADKLGTVRKEIEEAPPQHSAGTARRDYATEQSLQVRWGSVMRQQLDAVREVQTGMLIGLNKQEDRAKTGEVSEESSTITTGDRVSGQRSTGSIEGESSVEATLDVTTTGDFGEHGGAGAIPSLFQRFRSRLQARGRPEDNASAAAEAPRNGGVAQQTKTRVRANEGRPGGSGSGEADDDGANDLLQELASLRSELDTITGILNM
ncbi:hypothetical protein BWQ96_08300 [Gracilariopsis chorda]|uniref:Uncharacterized protein n=1 Tax=Gracilariopsis chorda TaxID=448386 RepID=A0A2V3IIY4_9FLOR|nr:hypothetical protein BWQ96_08300 [Gracilariopsis chorda]|eukprot:PXF41993.1 hypothetical protein BWQ96_08300 [Gracilariopsis chorda]